MKAVRSQKPSGIVKWPELYPESGKGPIAYMKEGNGKPDLHIRRTTLEASGERQAGMPVWRSLR